MEKEVIRSEGKEEEFIRSNTNFDNLFDYVLYLGKLRLVLGKGSLRNGNKNNDIDITQFMGDTNELNVSQNTRINLNNVFKDIWSDDQIKVIAKLLLQANENEDTSKNYVKAISNVLKSKENEIKNTIQKISQII